MQRAWPVRKGNWDFAPCVAEPFGEMSQCALSTTRQRMIAALLAMALLFSPGPRPAAAQKVGELGLRLPEFTEKPGMLNCIRCAC